MVVLLLFGLEMSGAVGSFSQLFRSSAWADGAALGVRSSDQNHEETRTGQFPVDYTVLLSKPQGNAIHS